MGKLIKDEGQGVNFQKASCTLDASVKIYSNRVDDTYTSSHRILESLSRNGNNDREEDDGDDDNNEDSGPKVVKARVGTKANSDKLNLTSTIEKNVSALNVVAVENDYHVDPMFVRMSQAFDEGGAKGMLMYNMRLQPNSCSLSFDCKALHEEVKSKAAGDSAEPTGIVPAPVVPPGHQDPFLDLGDLVARAGLSVQDLCSLSICPPLDDYRQAAGVPECLVGLMDPFNVSATDHIFSGASDGRRSYGSTTSSAPVTGHDGPSAPSFGGGNDMDMMDDNNDDYNDYGGDDGGDNDYEEPSVAEGAVPTRPSLLSVGRSSIGSAVGKTKLNWDSSANASSPAKSADIQLIAEGLESLQILSENYVNPYVKDYSVFDVDALISNNTWAGARHWKYATRRKEASSTLAAAAKLADAAIAASQADPVEELEEEEETTAAGKKRKAAPKKASKASKEILPISFTLDLVNEAEFELPAKNKRDASLQTTAALEKASSAAEINALLLPYDSKLQLKDLCRLFLAPKVIVPPAQFHSIVQQSLVKSASSSSSRAMRRETEEEQDFIWGQRGVPTQTASASRHQQHQISSSSPDDEGAGDDFYDDNDDGGGWDDDYDQGAQQTESSGVPLTGLEINQSKLLQAGRIVEKIQIDYAKKSKLVNIQRLKMDIWAGVDNTLHIDEPVPEKATEKVPETLSFQHLISDIAADPRQKDVSISFYFICLLHLANEHGLQIEDREDMADLVISKGGV
eukprot:gene26475-33056_t